MGLSTVLLVVDSFPLGSSERGPTNRGHSNNTLNLFTARTLRSRDEFDRRARSFLRLVFTPESILSPALLMLEHSALRTKYWPVCIVQQIRTHLTPTNTRSSWRAVASCSMQLTPSRLESNVLPSTVCPPLLLTTRRKKRPDFSYGPSFRSLDCFC